MVCRGERKEMIVWSDKIQIVVCDIGLSSLLIKKNQLPVDEPVVYKQQRKSNPTVTLLVWLLKHPELP